MIDPTIAARGLIYFIAANTILQPTICGLIKETNDMSCRIYLPWLKCHRELNLIKNPLRLLARAALSEGTQLNYKMNKYSWEIECRNQTSSAMRANFNVVRISSVG